jgi:hypothetical protein
MKNKTTNQDVLSRRNFVIGTAAISSLMAGQSKAQTFEMPGPDKHVNDMLLMGEMKTLMGLQKKPNRPF